MHVTKPADPSGRETRRTPPRMAQRMLARRAGAVVVALSLALGGSLLVAGTASAEVLGDPTSETGTSSTEGGDMSTEGGEGPALVGSGTPGNPGGGGPPPPPPPPTRVKFCHWTTSPKNPYVLLEMSTQEFFNAGYGVNGNDIVPPFLYLDDNVNLRGFPGLNWGQGTVDIYFADCGTPDPTVVVISDVDTVQSGTPCPAMVTLNNLVVGEDYALTVIDKDDRPVGTFDPKMFTADAASDDIMVTGLPAPGDYNAVFEWDELPAQNLPITYTITVEFSLDECPELASELASTGADSTALPLGLGLLTIGAALMLATRLMRREQLFPPMVSAKGLR